MSKRGFGGYQLQCAPMIADGETQWEQVLSIISATEEQVFMAVQMPDTPEAKTLRRRLQIRLQQKNFRDKYYIPDAIVDWLGWKEYMERRFSGDLLGGRPQKRKRRTAKNPQQAQEVSA
jgi:hypothetical protein